MKKGGVREAPCSQILFKMYGRAGTVIINTFQF